MKKSLLFGLVMLAAAAMMLSSCGGDVRGSTSIEGVVTDAPIDGSDVTIYSMATGEEVGTAVSGNDGTFAISVNLSAYSPDDVFFAIAEGGAVDGAEVDFLKFKSIIGNVEGLSAAGADGTVSASEAPDLTVSNVTTAKVAIVEAIEGITIDADVDLSEQAETLLDTQADVESENLSLIISIAADIKAVVDDAGNTELTDLLGDMDIAEYVASNIDYSEITGQITTSIDAAIDTAGDDLEDDILADEALIDAATGDTGEAPESGDIEGDWYGYHADTWGESDWMGGPGLIVAVVSADAGDCEDGQIAIEVTEEGAVESDLACGTLTGNVLNFSLPMTGPGDQPAVVEAVGTIDGEVMNGTYSMKDASGATHSGGIFKLGRDTDADYSGVYDFSGVYTAMFVSSAISGGPEVGDSGTFTGTFAIDGVGGVDGTITDAEGDIDLIGELEGPRIKARMFNPTAGPNGSTTFIVFLINDPSIMGMYMSFDSEIEDPSGDTEPVEGGKFVITMQ